MRKCLEKQDGAHYPTVKSIHAAIMKRSDLPKWSRQTTFTILKLLRFSCLENRDIHFGLLIENEYTTDKRKNVCQQIKKLLSEGYYLLFFDET